MKNEKTLHWMDKITDTFEIVIAGSLLIIIAIKVVEISTEMIGFPITILAMEFEKILSTVLTLIIGVEFTKMLYKHTPEIVIDVLIFAITRQMVIYYEKALEMLIGMIAIVGLFAAKRFLIDKSVKSMFKKFIIK